MKETTVTEQRVKAQYSEKWGVMGRICVCVCVWVFGEGCGEKEKEAHREKKNESKK